MPAPARARSFGGGGGGGGGGRRGFNSRYNQDLNRAAACKQPGCEGSSIKSGGGDYDLPDCYEYFMSMDRGERCGIVKRLLEKRTRNGRKLIDHDVRYFERYLVDCPDVPNLKNLSASAGELNGAPTSSSGSYPTDVSSSYSSEEYFMKLEQGERCGRFMHLLERLTRDGRKLSKYQVPFFEKHMADCPNAPNLKDLTENGENSEGPSLDEYFMAKKPESRCWIFMIALERVLQRQRELNASQIAHFKKFMWDCPNVPDFLS